MSQERFSEFDHHCMTLALGEAEEALNTGNYPVGAVLTIDGSLVGQARNSILTDSQSTSHAEQKLLSAHSSHLRRLARDDETHGGARRSDDPPRATITYEYSSGFSRLSSGAITYVDHLAQEAPTNKLAALWHAVYTILEKKFFFDEVYGVLLVWGTIVAAHISRIFDKYFVDGLVNLSAFITERLSALSGLVLDNKGIDGVVNGIGGGAWDLAGTIRQAQNGRIRNYVMFATGSVAAIVIVILFVR